MLYGYAPLMPPRYNLPLSGYSESIIRFAGAKKPSYYSNIYYYQFFGYFLAYSSSCLTKPSLGPAIGLILYIISRTS